MLKKEESYHFIGIGGIGMSALCTILIQRGCKVSGSDITKNATTLALEKEGAKIFEGHSEKHLPKEKATVIYSSAILEDNPELVWARKNSYPLMHRSELLALLLQEKKALCVAGTHGKTTTSALLAHLLVEAGLDPSYAIGGNVSSLKGNGKSGNGSFFVAEADESDGSFLKIGTLGAVVTNIEPDHLDYWENEENLLRGFQQFFEKIESKEVCFWCLEDESLRSIKPKGCSYGFSKEASFFIKNYRQVDWKLMFDACFEGKEFEEVEVPIIGAHNVLNAAAVFGLGLRLKIPEETIREAFLRFNGIERRFEKKGEIDGILIYDDYAHHPTEIFATLRAIKSSLGDKRLVVAFQPHRFTRTKECLEQFPDAFKHADHVVLTDIYSAGEPSIEGVTSEKLLSILKEKSPHKFDFVKRSLLTSFLAEFLKPRDLFITMGAGDITHVGPELIELRERRE